MQTDLSQPNATETRKWQQGLAGFRRPQDNAFCRARIWKCSQQKRSILRSKELQIDHIISIVAKRLWESKQDFVLQKQSVRKLSKSRMVFVESSTKAGWLSQKALRKQDDFCWKQNDFRWKLYKIRMSFVESSTKAFQKVCKSWQY